MREPGGKLPKGFSPTASLSQRVEVATDFSAFLRGWKRHKILPGQTFHPGPRWFRIGEQRLLSANVDPPKKVP
jgi:hypothetical protein